MSRVFFCLLALLPAILTAPVSLPSPAASDLNASIAGDHGPDDSYTISNNSLDDNYSKNGLDAASNNDLDDSYTAPENAVISAMATKNGQGLFVSSFNGDVMEVIDAEMSIFHKDSGKLIGHVNYAATPFFYGEFPWGIVKMLWDGEAWQESGSPNVVGFLANARWEPMIHAVNASRALNASSAASFDWPGWEPGSLAKAGSMDGDDNIVWEGSVVSSGAGDGSFISSWNRDQMHVSGSTMKVFKAGNLMAEVGNVAYPSFVGSFPWADVEMIWDGSAWMEGKGGPTAYTVTWEPTSYMGRSLSL